MGSEGARPRSSGSNSGLSMANPPPQASKDTYDRPPDGTLIRINAAALA